MNGLKKLRYTYLSAACGFFLLFFQAGGGASMSLYLLAEDIDVEAFYTRVQELNRHSMPKQFQAQIRSLLVSQQLKNIPSDMVEFGEKPKLFLLHKQGFHPRLKVRHVSSFYVNFFSPYERLIRFSGLFLGIDRYNSYAKLTRFFVFKVEKKGDKYIVLGREREGLPGDYAEYTYSKQLNLISARFFEAHSLGSESTFFFKEKSAIRYPYRITIDIYDKGQSLNSSLVHAGKEDAEESHTRLVINLKNYDFSELSDSSLE